MCKQCDLVLKINIEIFCYINYQLKYGQHAGYFLEQKNENLPLFTLYLCIFSHISQSFDVFSS